MLASAPVDVASPGEARVVIIRWIKKVDHLDRTGHWPDGGFYEGKLFCVKCMKGGKPVRTFLFSPLQTQRSLVP